MSLSRLRQAAPALRAILAAAALVALSACGGDYPNSTFNPNTEFNTAIDALFDRLVFWGTIVFVLVETVLLVTIIRFRKRPGGPEAKQIHGNAALEITWTAVPAIILVLIAIPTVKTIFQTQAPAPAGALEVEVIGHQWWWEFRYPEYGITTANEVYVPVGRPINFKLNTVDVIHSFWFPQLGGKRDLITNKTNYLWFTVADSAVGVYNGFCTEYCGASHANMRIRLFAVTPDQFASWAQHQASASQVALGDSAKAPGYSWPAADLPAHTVPQTPMPADVAFDDNLLAQGDATRGQTTFVYCAACHAVKGDPIAQSPIAPNLTHLASRHTIAGGLYPNTPEVLARWIKRPGSLKPGAIMNTHEIGAYDPVRKITVSAATGLSDQQIADIVAYLQTLK